MPTSFPVLPTLMLPVERELIWPEDDYESISGVQTTIQWWSSGVHHFRLPYSGLRDEVMAPAPWNAYSELDALIKAYTDNRNGTQASYTFTDPVDGVSRNVRFVGPLKKRRIIPGWWAVEVEVREVK
jgi:hypothetical protein